MASAKMVPPGSGVARSAVGVGTGPGGVRGWNTVRYNAPTTTAAATGTAMSHGARRVRRRVAGFARTVPSSGVVVGRARTVGRTPFSATAVATLGGTWRLKTVASVSTGGGRLVRTVFSAANGRSAASISAG